MAEIPSGHRGFDAVVARAREFGASAIGRSVLGAPLVAIERGSGANVTFVVAGLHALEWIGVETALAIVEHIVAAPDLAPDRRIVVVPIANPDGYQRVEADLVAGRRRFRRGNARDVDLNRNWPTDFHRARVRVPPSFLSHGAAPASEPEVRAILDRLDAEVTVGRTIDRAISLHSFGRKLLVPWGSRWRRPSRDRELRVHAESIGARIGERYTIDQASRWVPGQFTPGMEIDHLHARYGARAILVECSRGGFHLRDPRTWIAPFHWYNPADPRAIADELARALLPFVRGDV